MLKSAYPRHHVCLADNRNLTNHCRASHEFAYIILAGAVRIWTHDVEARRVTLLLLGPNDFFGELAVLDGGPRSASATAEEDTILGGLRKEQLEHFLLTHPQTALHMIKQLGKRLRQTNKLI